MNKARLCGNCSYYTRIKSLPGRGNGLCEIFDRKCNSDSRLAVSCEKYKRQRPTDAKDRRISTERDIE